MAGRRELKKLANGIAKHFNFRIEEVNKNAFALWDDYEALINVINFKGDIGIGLNMGLEKLDIASIMVVATRLYPDVGLATPFFFDYRSNQLYGGSNALLKAREAEFYYNLQAMAHGNDLGEINEH